MPNAADVLRTGFHLHTRLFLNALDGIGDEAARARLDERTNSVAFVALHLVDVRHYTLTYAGGRAENPFSPLLAGISGIDELQAIPRLDEIRAAWSTEAPAAHGFHAETRRSRREPRKDSEIL